MYKYDTSNSAESCRLTSRPSVALLQLHLLCWFATGIIMSSWVWTKSSAEAWKRYIRKYVIHNFIYLIYVIVIDYSILIYYTFKLVLN